LEAHPAHGLEGVTAVQLSDQLKLVSVSSIVVFMMAPSTKEAGKRRRRSMVRDWGPKNESRSHMRAVKWAKRKRRWKEKTRKPAYAVIHAHVNDLASLIFIQDFLVPAQRRNELLATSG
jgi:hypothetical protein